MVKARAQELDFLGLENRASDRRRSCFKGIQNAISKMNPEVIKSVIASASSNSTLHLRPTAPPSCSRGMGSEKMREQETAAMTIFYNGMVTVFDAPKHQAASILRMAMAESSANNVESPNKAAASSLDHQGLPISRRKSLERFFEKRKERLLWVSPARPYEVSKGNLIGRSCCKKGLIS